MSSQTRRVLFLFRLLAFRELFPGELSVFATRLRLRGGTGAEADGEAGRLTVLQSSIAQSLFVHVCV